MVLRYSGQMSKGSGKTEAAAGAPNSPIRPLVEALRRLLRPLVRLLIARGITYPYLTGLLKRLYVEVAEADFALPDKAQTVSRVSLLSGVHRKDVARLLEEGVEESEVPRAVSLGAQLINTWMTESRFLDKQGRPKVLVRTSSSARRATFETLVEAVHRKDVRPRAVLDELRRVGAVRVDEDDNVVLLTEALVPEGAFEELAWYFGANLRDHIAAAARNMDGAEPAFPERALHHDGLSAASAEVLRELAKNRGMEFLRELNTKAARLAKRDLAAGDAPHRITVGFYFDSDAYGSDAGSGSGSDKDETSE
ncbi:MAG: hypothetical protein ACI8TX_000074 [Hyphomicrobiaceae bacterium]